MPNRPTQIKLNILNIEKNMEYLDKKKFYALCNTIGKV